MAAQQLPASARSITVSAIVSILSRNSPCLERGIQPSDGRRTFTFR
jgi:hypothetical protein